MNEFKVGDLVKDAVNGDMYVILAEPNDKMLLESTGDRFYSYRASGGDIVWHRCQHGMEDGRFKKEKP